MGHFNEPGGERAPAVRFTSTFCKHRGSVETQDLVSDPARPCVCTGSHTQAGMEAGNQRQLIENAAFPFYHIREVMKQ